MQCISSIHSICIRTFSNFFSVYTCTCSPILSYFCFGQDLKLATFVGLVSTILQTTSLVLIHFVCLELKYQKGTPPKFAVIYCVFRTIVWCLAQNNSQKRSGGGNRKKIEKQKRRDFYWYVLKWKRLYIVTFVGLVSVMVMTNMSL